MDEDSQALLDNEAYQSTMVESIDRVADTSPRSYEQWEVTNKLMLLDASGLDLTEVVDLDTFKDTAVERGVRGVDIHFRTDWLLKNEYDVTRDNLLNANLTAAGE